VLSAEFLIVKKPVQKFSLRVKRHCVITLGQCHNVFAKVVKLVVEKVVGM